MTGNMDKTWMTLSRGDPRFEEGVWSFCEFVQENRTSMMGLHMCPCKKCLLKKYRLTVEQMYAHLLRNGMMRSYTNWVYHGEASDTPSLYEQRQAYLQRHASSSASADPSINPTMNLLVDAFPFRDRIATDFVDDVNINTDYYDFTAAKDAYEKYNKLLSEAHDSIVQG